MNFIFCRLLNFLQEVFSYLLWFFFRLGPVAEVNSPCSPVQAQVESGKFLMCYISQLKVCSLCLCESKPFFLCNQVDCSIGFFFRYVFTVAGKDSLV